MKLKKIFKNIWWFLGASNTINNFPDAIIYVNTEGYIVKINKKAKEIFILNDGISPVRLNDIIPEGMIAVKNSAKLKKSVLTQADIEGHKFYIELMASKKGHYYLVSVRNKTQLTNDKDTELQIEKFNNEKNAMLIKLKSELKSPLESITGFSKGMLEGLGGELTDKQVKYVKIINNNANDLNEFLDKLLEFTYSESLLYTPEYKKFDVVAITKEVLKNFESKFEDKKLDFNFDYGMLENRSICNDLEAYKKIIENILTVSINTTDNGGISLTLKPVDAESSISFGLIEGKSYLQISIMDTGVGIEPEEMHELCDPYFHADKGRKNLLRALRLGSASILVKRSDGFIDISSELMRGTIYNIVIPTEKEADE